MGGTSVPLKELPTYLPQAFIAIEDRRFYRHFGIDPIGVTRAIVANVTAPRRVARRLDPHPAARQEPVPDPGAHARAQAAGGRCSRCGWNANIPRTQILELYLNRVYFGAGAYGVEAAAQRYFGKSARDVTLAEAAMLAGLVKSPSRLAPTRNPEPRRSARTWCSPRWPTIGFVTPGDGEDRDGRPPHIVAKPAAPARPTMSPTGSMDVLNDLSARSTRTSSWRPPSIRALQAVAEKALVEELRKSGDKFGVSQGAMRRHDARRRGKRLVGGRNYAESQFNRAVAAKRQPGSAFKPFVYLAALERGLTPDTVRDDRPINVQRLAAGELHAANISAPVHADARARACRSTRSRCGSARSRPEGGRAHRAAARHRLAAQSNASIALGTSEVSALELAAAYAPFANGGTGDPARDRARAQRRASLYARSEPARPRGDARMSAMMNAMLQQTLVSGTAQGRAAGLAGGRQDRHLQDFRDAWFIGYTSLVTGVWLGNDDDADEEGPAAACRSRSGAAS